MQNQDLLLDWHLFLGIRFIFESKFRKEDAIYLIEKGNPEQIVRYEFKPRSLDDRVERFSYQLFNGQLSGGFIIIDARHTFSIYEIPESIKQYC